MTEIVWGHSALRLVFAWDDNSPVRLVSLGNSQDVESIVVGGPPAVEILTGAEGREQSSERLVRTIVGSRMRYRGHTTNEDGRRRELRLVLEDTQACLEAEIFLNSWEGVAGFRSTVTVRDTSGSGGQMLLAVPSWSSGIGIALEASSGESTQTRLVRGSSDWLAEGRWESVDLRNQLLPNLSLFFHGQNARGRYSEVSTGTWSTGHNLPVAAIESTRCGVCLAWQVEHNGPWRWELGEDIRGLSLSLSGPTDVDHQWSRTLAPGAEFTSIPVSITIGRDFNGAIAQLTSLRRESRRPHPDQHSMGVIFNDYMNTLMGDPTTEKLLPLIDAAAEHGAEIFCVDAGWYDDGNDWWDAVGEWKPSTTRFPNGLREVIDRITDQGMIPGLWLEPEVIGVRSRLATQLPDAAFLLRSGERVLEQGRYHLNLSHPAARKHLDNVIDRLVDEFGVGYFKLDYNIDPGPGTDAEGSSVGDGLLIHNLAYLDWLEGALDRHPNLVLENCSSGAMRMDFALLSRMQLQSTSDQQDYLRYPPIAASAPLSMLPEQAANWAYPQSSMTAEQIGFCLSMGILGRYFLSGYLNQMEPDQLALVDQAVDAHKQLRPEIRNSVPVWPLGLPGWTDTWIALGLRPEQDHSVLLTLWKRAAGEAATVLDLPSLRGRDVEVEVIFPVQLAPWDFSWNREQGLMSVRAESTEVATARTVRIRSRRDAAGTAIEAITAEPKGPTQ